MTVKYVLRDMPGVQELETVLEKIQEHPHPHWAPENDRLPELIERVSLSLFGITPEDTEPRPTPGQSAAAADEAWERWEQHFRMLTDEDEETVDVVLRAMGWDVSDGGPEGKWLMAFDCLARPLICATKGLRGRLPDAIDEAEAVESAKDWGEGLAAEAAKFKGKRR